MALVVQLRTCTAGIQRAGSNNQRRVRGPGARRREACGKVTQFTRCHPTGPRAPRLVCSQRFGAFNRNGIPQGYLLSTLTLARKRVGELNAAAWLVLHGTLVIIGEHPFFAIWYTMRTTPPLNLVDPAALGPLFPHARYHFFMSGVHHRTTGVACGHRIPVA